MEPEQPAEHMEPEEPVDPVEPIEPVKTVEPADTDITDTNPLVINEKAATRPQRTQKHRTPHWHQQRS